MKHRATCLLLAGTLGLATGVSTLVLFPAAAPAAANETKTAKSAGDRPAHGPGQGPRDRRGGRGLETAAKVLGTTVEALRTALQRGQSLAGLAEEAGVGRQALVDALVAEHTERLEEAVSSGRLTRAEADRRKAGLAEHVARHVDRVGPPARGHRGGPREAPATS